MPIESMPWPDTEPLKHRTRSVETAPGVESNLCEILRNWVLVRGALALVVIAVLIGENLHPVDDRRLVEGPSGDGGAVALPVCPNSGDCANHPGLRPVAVAQLG